jgi:type I restriction enzyme S subunit
MSEEWVETTVGALVSLEYGKALPERERDGQGFPVLGSAGVVGLHSKPLVKGPGIVVGRKGTAGSVTWVEQDFSPIDTAYWVNKKETNLSLEFTFLLMSWLDLPSVCAQTGVPGLNRDRAYTLPVLLPPLPVQRRIVDVMTHVDSHLATLRAERNVVEQLLATARAAEFDSLLPILPISDVLSDAKAGGTPDRSNSDFYDGDVPWLKSGEVDNPHIESTSEFITKAALASSSAWLVPARTTVLAMYGATAGVVGFTEIALTTNQAVLALVSDSEKSDSRFLYHWLKFNSAKLKAAASGAAQPNLSKQVVLREMGFPALTVAEQQNVAGTLDAIETLGLSSHEEWLSLSTFRSRVLGAILSGSFPLASQYDSLLSEVA